MCVAIASPEAIGRTEFAYSSRSTYIYRFFARFRREVPWVLAPAVLPFCAETFFVFVPEALVPVAFAAAFLVAGAFGGGDLCRDLAALIAFAPRIPTERILATAFLMGSFPFADEFPTSAPPHPRPRLPRAPRRCRR